MTPSGESPEYPFWSYEDLALFVGAVFPSLAIAFLVARVARFGSEGVQTIAFQSCFDALMLGTLYLLVAGRYGRPFWRGLAWTVAFPGAWLTVVAGPVLAVFLAALGAALHAPGVPTIQNLVTDRASLVLVVLFGSLVGPISEELVFRGFLLPLLTRSLGRWSGILLSAAPFALLHGPQYHWSWQSMFMIGIAGSVFGYTRHKTDSTAAAALVHMGYNATLVAGFLLQRM